MKIVFSTKNVSRSSFLDVCRYADDYGFQGFEIYDAVAERLNHHDSILRHDRIADAKRKLVNRSLSVSGMVMVFCTSAFSLFGVDLILPRRISINHFILFPQI